MLYIISNIYIHIYIYIYNICYIYMHIIYIAFDIIYIILSVLYMLYIMYIIYHINIYSITSNHGTVMLLLLQRVCSYKSVFTSTIVIFISSRINRYFVNTVKPVQTTTSIRHHSSKTTNGESAQANSHTIVTV